MYSFTKNTKKKGNIFSGLYKSKKSQALKFILYSKQINYPDFYFINSGAIYDFQTESPSLQLAQISMFLRLVVISFRNCL